MNNKTVPPSSEIGIQLTILDRRFSNINDYEVLSTEVGETYDQIGIVKLSCC